MIRTNKDLYEPISDINVTPFVDVLMVLLVAFMITAPLFTNAIDIKLPKENVRSSSIKNVKKLVISIDRKGYFFISDKRYKLDRIKALAQIWVSDKKDHSAYIRADKKVDYGQVTQVMATLKEAGIRNIGLLVEEKK